MRALVELHYFSSFHNFVILPSHFSPHQTQNENEFETFLSSSFAATHLSLRVRQCVYLFLMTRVFIT